MRQGEYGEIAAPAKQLYEELKDRKWLDRGKFYIERLLSSISSSILSRILSVCYQVFHQVLHKSDNKNVLGRIIAFNFQSKFIELLQNYKKISIFYISKN